MEYKIGDKLRVISELAIKDDYVFKVGITFKIIYHEYKVWQLRCEDSAIYEFSKDTLDKFFEKVNEDCDSGAEHFDFQKIKELNRKSDSKLIEFSQEQLEHMTSLQIFKDTIIIKFME